MGRKNPPLGCVVCFCLVLTVPTKCFPRYLSSKAEMGCDLTPLLPIQSGGARILPRTGDNGFSLKLEGIPEFYEPEKTYTVTLRSTYPVTFRGFALTALLENTSAPAGSFRILNPWLTKAMDSCEHVITHTSSGKKSQVQLVWTSPQSGLGCVTFKASVIQKGTIWFQEDDDLSLRICESPVQEEVDSGMEEHGCCACGSAQYRMTFYGLWSPETHPKDYPTYSTHWSNIIGASHDNRYSVWDYGEYASDGVKKVAEWGWPSALEDEIRGQDDRVMSVIKTRAQWPAYQPRNIREPPSNVFNVDKDRHLVSFLTMLGPSPDWNVGISKESMCTRECGWKATETFDLTPWDAGTDSGLSYLSPNSPTRPQEQIRALTSSDDPASPFYDPAGGPIPPVARVVLERLALAGEQCSEGEPSQPVSAPTPEGAAEPTGLSCRYGEWSGWSSCGVTCGWSIKVRSKELTENMTESALCQQTIMEKEICKGASDCDEDAGNTDCLYSDWSAWSECTSSCGKDALRFRRRELKWPSEPDNCHEPLKDMKFDCNTSPCAEGDSACEYNTWSDWMPCSAQCGIGSTLRKRFATGGAGCESPSMEFSKCMASIDCTPPAGFDVPTGCAYSPWTGWMPCPVSCGVGETFRKRVLASSAPNVHCEDLQMERTKCMTSESCPDATPRLEARRCQYSEWTEWMPCSVSCGVGITFRKRFLAQPAPGVDCDGFEMESVKCYMPPCHIMERRKNIAAPSNATCMYGPWTAWMPCSVTCGRGTTLRKRFLQKSLDISMSCEGFKMEINQCTVPDSCQDIVSRESAEVAVAPGSWGEWSACSVTCGEGQRTRSWTGDSGCGVGNEGCKEAEIDKCVVTKFCPIDCVLSQWSNWSRCGPCRSATSHPESKTRRRRTKQSRIRLRLTRPSHGGSTCGSRKERRRCTCSVNR